MLRAGSFDVLGHLKKISISPEKQLNKRQTAGHVEETGATEHLARCQAPVLLKYLIL
jgi:hypothetical protein